MSKAESEPIAESGRLARLKAGLKHAFSVDSPHGPLTDEDRALLRRLAEAIERRGMSTPAAIFLESVHPAGFLGSQALQFLQPFLSAVFKGPDYDRFVKILERREGLSSLVDEIEAVVAEAGEPKTDEHDEAPDASTNDNTQ